MKSSALRITAWTAVVLMVLVGGVWWAWSAYAAAQQPLQRDRNAFVGSNTCLSCHADHHASWKRTYHRTMTQEASGTSVQGQFDGKVVNAWGVPVRPVHRDGKYLFEYLDPSTQAVKATVEVARTVGSHRYQQYLSKDADGRYARMHLIWHIGDQRWVHYNGAFLYDDHQGFNQHAAVWNPNCIFCHNTGVNPNITNEDALLKRALAGERFNYLNAAHWDSEVAELGIACESCHGAGGTHAQANRNPLRRYALHFSGAGDATITNPKRLTPQRSAEVCGQCHGQRTPAKLEMASEWLRSGPSYRAGDVLAEHVSLVQPDTPVPAGDPDLFRLRFWKDGTPRLSAYEMQGLLQSDCYTRGGATCIGCHEAHGGTPTGMITEDNRTGASCIGCHKDAAALPAHAAHAKASPTTNCVDCHMPKMVYGVMEIHRTHRIRAPAPLAAASNKQPDACTTCHGNRSGQWAADAVSAWRRGAVAATATASIPENLRQLFEGDPVQRAVAAKLAGSDKSALTNAERAAQLPLLFAAMEDGYPAVRRFAQQSARVSADRLALPQLAKALQGFDFIGAGTARATALQAIRSAAPATKTASDALGGLLNADGSANAALLSSLRAQADTTAINIGE
ncbi:MAG: ammonia-forming cytochrome c nitrite reductase subunit c552 [Stagnimonas sp.]|nr:ammonia-forming cytochrome c nitrite reductase subunit c552 [Stagnimonas sp.]